MARLTNNPATATPDSTPWPSELHLGNGWTADLKDWSRENLKRVNESRVIGWYDTRLNTTRERGGWEKYRMGPLLAVVSYAPSENIHFINARWTPPIFKRDWFPLSSTRGDHLEGDSLKMTNVPIVYRLIRWNNQMDQIRDWYRELAPRQIKSTSFLFQILLSKAFNVKDETHPLS